MPRGTRRSRTYIHSYAFSCIREDVFSGLKILGLNNASDKLLKWYSVIIVFVMTVLSLSNIIIFKFWGTLLNNRALAYVAQPEEMLASVTNMQLFLILLFYFLFCNFNF